MPVIHQGKTLQSAIATSGYSVAEVARRMGIARQRLYIIFKNEQLNADTIKAAAKALDMEEGTLFPEETTGTVNDNGGLEGDTLRYRKATVHKIPKRVPFYDAPADASDVDGDQLPVTQPTGYIATGDLFGSNCEAVIRIRGASMAKTYPAGSLLGLTQNLDSFLLPGEVYVLETRSQRVFKRVYEDDKRPDHWECYSDNTEIFTEGQRAGKPVYPQFYVPKEEVIKRWTVVGSAREEGNSIIIHSMPY